MGRACLSLAMRIQKNEPPPVLLSLDNWCLQYRLPCLVVLPAIWVLAATLLYSATATTPINTHFADQNKGSWKRTSTAKLALLTNEQRCTMQYAMHAFNLFCLSACHLASNRSRSRSSLNGSSNSA
jgi:hypothetical protein